MTRIAKTALVFLCLCAAATQARSRLPSYVAGVGPAAAIVWNARDESLDVYSIASGKRVDQVPFETKVGAEAAYDAKSRTFWGSGVRSDSGAFFLWEWRPGTRKVHTVPLRAQMRPVVIRDATERLISYIDEAGKTRLARVGCNLKISALLVLPASEPETAACTFSGNDTPMGETSSYVIDRARNRTLQECPPADAERCAEKHWYVARVPDDAWLFCASDCLTCQEFESAHWTERARFPPESVDRLTGLTADPFAPGDVYALAAHGETSQLFVTRDAAQSWQPMEIGHAEAAGPLFFTADAVVLPIYTSAEEERSIRLLWWPRNAGPSREVTLALK